MREILAMLAVTLVGTGGVALAQSPKGYHEHDGFFLQMDLGGGTLSNRYSYQGSRYEMSGAAEQLAVTVGAAVLPDLIVAGQLWGMTVDSPTVKENGRSFSTPGDTSLWLNGVGLNLTYYFMPINVYVSATPSLASVSLDEGGGASQGGVTYETKNGFAIRLAVGKEWWVSHNWGLGLNLQYSHSSNTTKQTNVRMSSNWFGLALSATYS